MLPGSYQKLYEQLRQRIPEKRLICDPLRTLAFGTDASFYRLIPKIVVQVVDEGEMSYLMQCAGALNISVTFRAAGTSLSGQAISDSVLAVATGGWQQSQVMDQGDKIRLGPGVIGAQANKILAPYGRKIGPDPASINAAMIGGIFANNASGMCCGTAQNSYQTVDSLRIILHDGTLLDTANPHSRAAFERSHSQLLQALKDLGRKATGNAALASRIREKFRIKNTTGYSLNALVDFTDPFDILVHLMVGAEGTLGFVSEVVYRTVVEHPFKASALMIFDDIDTACRSTAILKTKSVSAAEIMDRAALRSVESKPAMPAIIKGLPDKSTALLVETRASSRAQLAENIEQIGQALGCVILQMPGGLAAVDAGSVETSLECSATQLPVHFTDDPDAYNQLWNVRKGLFPSVGAMRATGTTVIIEDIAFAIDNLAPATLSLQSLFKKHHYHEAIIFGHALEGNLHFVFTQDFSRGQEIDRYRRFMDDVVDLVVNRFDGSLKAEHGTGRNMAPFVEHEWGKEAYGLMRDIKSAFDPAEMLNPGVILNSDPQAHLNHLKPLPPAHPIIDKCIECGFCEVNCPSRDLTLTPRQRIVVQREIARLKASGENEPALSRLIGDYDYQGNLTCAADGLCAVSCPVDINTGQHTKWLRSVKVAGGKYQWLADQAAERFGCLTSMLRWLLRCADGAHRLLGTEQMIRITGALRRLSGNRVGLWTAAMPIAVPGSRLERLGKQSVTSTRQVVYVPSCISRTMGPARGDPDQKPLFEVMLNLLAKAGYQAIVPENAENLCCGVPFESKGFFDQADRKSKALETVLDQLSQRGRLPILMDTSPCVERMRRFCGPRLNIYEPVEFIHQYLMPELEFEPIDGPVAVHVTCSARKMGLEKAFRHVAAACSRHTVFPETVGCCGFAGDKGFHQPELNASALAGLKSAVNPECRQGFSNSRTCEIGLTHHSGIAYQSIVYLVDRCSRPRVSVQRP